MLISVFPISVLALEQLLPNDKLRALFAPGVWLGGVLLDFALAAGGCCVLGFECLGMGRTSF